jgi:hypothetical protein
MTRGDGAAGPRVARSDALLRARVREETLALCTRIEELEKENRRLAQAAVIAAAAERQNRARFGPDGPSRDTKLADPVRLAALLRIPDGHVVHRIDADGIIHSGGPPARPGEALCLDVGQLERIETARGIAAALSAYRDALGQASRETGELVRERDAALTRAATLAVQLENERRSVGAATAAATKEINDLTTKLEASGEAQRGLVKERDEASTALAALDVERRAERDLREAAEASTTTALSERDVAVECAREAEERAATASTAAVAARAGAVKAEAEAESRLTALKVSERAREASETREGIFARQLADAFSEAKESSKTAAKEMASRIAAQQERDRALAGC